MLATVGSAEVSLTRAIISEALILSFSRDWPNLSSFAIPEEDADIEGVPDVDGGGVGSAVGEGAISVVVDVGKADGRSPDWLADADG